SFLWMMYRSGWATKPGQEHVLAITLRRDGFEWALEHSSLSHYDRALHASREEWERTRREPVRLQWDPERDRRPQPLPHRSLPTGLWGEAVHRYVTDWIVGIDDITATVRAAREQSGRASLPEERPYELAADLAVRIGCTDPLRAEGPG